MDWLFNPNALWVLSGSILLGVSSGVLGSFAMLRRRSLMGDAMAHAALPGIGIAFLLAGTRSLPVLLTGALLAGLLGAWMIQLVTRYTRIKEDTAMGLVLSVFFAVGIVVLTKIQHTGAGNQSGLDKFLFGQAASMIMVDVQVIAGSAAVVCLLAVLLFKEFKLLCFDEQFAQGIGFSPRLVDSILMLLIVLTVVIGMQAVGVILMAAMLITPAAAARLWTDKLSVMVWLAGVTGAISGALGTILSTQGFRMPTGPLIVISATAIFAFSLVFAPHKGIIARLWRLVSLRKRVAVENVLRTLYELAEKRDGQASSFTFQDIARKRGISVKRAMKTIGSLVRSGDIVKTGNECSLSEQGLLRAYRIVRKHRLWEMFLMHESEIASDHVHRDADDIEHHLSPEIVEKLENLLKLHNLEMKLPGSVHPIK